MIDLDTVIAALNGAGIQAQASCHADPSQADAVPLVRSLGDAVTNGHTYPLRLPDDHPTPGEHGVYQLAARQHVEADGWTLARTDTWLMSLRAPTFDALRPMADQFVLEVANQTGVVAVEITDAASDYERDQRQCRAHFELQATAQATSTPALPGAFVHHVDATASENGLASCAIRQTVTENLAVVLIADRTDLQLVRGLATHALLGLEIPGGMSPLEYLTGTQLAVVGRHVYWRELYRYQRLIRAPEPGSTFDITLNYAWPDPE